MNIEKIKNYNQKLLAILGSIVVLMAAIGLIMLIFFSITEMTRSIRYNHDDDGILSDEKIEKLQQENKRKQLISYDFPRLVDTINSIYIIPVRHKTLNTAEYINDETLGLLDSYGEVKSNSRYSGYYYGSFNNLIVYDLKNGITRKLFDKRVNFGEIRTEVVGDDILILFTAAEEDTYRDGVVNLTDLKSLYIYSLKEGKLRSISGGGTDVVYYEFIPGSKDILVRLGIDYNEDGKFDSDSEPSIIKKYVYKSDELVVVIPQSLNAGLQKLLEGS